MPHKTKMVTHSWRCNFPIAQHFYSSLTDCYLDLYVCLARLPACTLLPPVTCLLARLSPYRPSCAIVLCSCCAPVHTLPLTAPFAHVSYTLYFSVLKPLCYPSHVSYVLPIQLLLLQPAVS